MIRLVCTLFLTVFLVSNAKAQFQFRLPTSILHYRIDLESKSLLEENHLGNWRLVGKLTFNKIDAKEIPSNIQIKAFQNDDITLLTIPGTGQVYSIDFNKLIFSRLDNTFYRGYNFHAIQYLKNDTLFSHGGMGFWHSNNVSTYFSNKSKEWEMVSIPDLSGPKWMSDVFGGYNQKRMVLSIIEYPDLYSTNTTIDRLRFFEKSLLTNQWKFLGNVNVSLIKDLGINRLESVFLNGNFFFMDGPIVVWADPQSNEVYQANKVIPMFDKSFEYIFKNGYYFSYNKVNTLNNSMTKILVDSISVSKLKLISSTKGEFYTTNKFHLWYWVLSIISAFVILLSIYFFRKKNKVNKDNEFISETIIGLPEGGFSFLLVCLTYPKGYIFSSQVLTEMMGYGSYAYETQRQVRSKLIKGINSYFWAHYRMKDVIIRQTASDDKRFSVYQISEEHYEFLKKLLTK